MRRVLVLMVMLMGMLCASKGTAAAAACEVYMSGTQKDVYNNTVFTAGTWLYVGDYADPYVCFNDALADVNYYAYQVCLNRPSAVTINMLGSVSLGGMFVNGWYAPGSCRTDFGLNYYTPLAPGQWLNPGDSLTSGSYQLRYQTDANLVLYNGSTAIWAINCWPVCNPLGPAGAATMQTDGNFVVYDDVGNPEWASNTGGSGTFLAVRSGRVQVYSASGNVLWQAP